MDSGTDDTDMGKLIHEALSEHILGAAMAVLNELNFKHAKLQWKRVVR